MEYVYCMTTAFFFFPTKKGAMKKKKKKKKPRPRTGQSRNPSHPGNNKRRPQHAGPEATHILCELEIFFFLCVCVVLCAAFAATRAFFLFCFPSCCQIVLYTQSFWCFLLFLNPPTTPCSWSSALTSNKKKKSECRRFVIPPQLSNPRLTDFYARFLISNTSTIYNMYQVCTNIHYPLSHLLKHKTCETKKSKKKKIKK